MKYLTALTIMFSTLFPGCHAQEKLSNEELKAMANSIETDWRYGRSPVIWTEDRGRFDYYLQTAPQRCLDDLTTVVEMTETWHLENLRILQFEKQVYPKPGSKKSEENLRKYFTDPEKAKKKFEAAKEDEQMYKRLIRETTPLIEAKKKETFKAPEGQLTYFYFRQGGGMLYRPPLQSILRQQKDGTYTVELDTPDFDRLDTIPLTQAQVDTVRQMLIEGEVYKMPPIYDEPMMVLDAPSSSVSVKFTDASYSCTNYPPSDWGGKSIWAVYKYLKGLQPEESKVSKELID
jgi:hypothetical protein